MKQAHLADGIALTRFMYWLKTQVGSQPITERSAAAQLEAFRRACPCTSSPVLTPFWPPVPTAPLSTTPPPRRVTAPSPARAFFWQTPADTTTPGPPTATRTYALGPLSEQEKTHYTAVLRGIWPWQTQPSRPAARAATWTTRPDSPCGNWVWTLTTAPATGGLPAQRP